MVRVGILVGIASDWLAGGHFSAGTHHVGGHVADLALHAVQLEPAANVSKAACTEAIGLQ